MIKKEIFMEKEYTPIIKLILIPIIILFLSNLFAKSNLSNNHSSNNKSNNNTYILPTVSVFMKDIRFLQIEFSSPYITNEIEDIIRNEDFEPFVVDLKNSFNDYNTPLDSLIFTVSGQNGVEITQVGSIINITPVEDWSGIDTIFFKATNYLNLSTIDTVNFLIIPQNDNPIIIAQDSLSTFEDSFYQLMLGDLIVTDPDNNYPNNFSLTIYDSLNYTHSDNLITPDIDFNGLLKVPVTVNDNAKRSISNRFILDLTVVSVDDPPILADIPDKIVDENSTLEFTAIASDVDNDIIRYSLVENSPSGTEINENSGDFEWTPNDNQTGEYTVSIIASSSPDFKKKNYMEKFISTLFKRSNKREILKDTTEVNITVNMVDDELIFDQIGELTVIERDTLKIGINAADPDTDEVFYYIDSGPDNAQIGVRNGMLTWVPPFDLVDNSFGFGRDTIRVRGEAGISVAFLDVKVKVVSRMFAKRHGDIRGSTVINPNSSNPEFARAMFEISDLENVKIKIFDINGRLLKNLRIENNGNSYIAYWYGKNRRNKFVKAGVYLYQIISKGKIKRNGFIGVIR